MEIVPYQPEPAGIWSWTGEISQLNFVTYLFFPVRHTYVGQPVSWWIALFISDYVVAAKSWCEILVYSGNLNDWKVQGDFFSLETAMQKHKYCTFFVCYSSQQ